MSRNTDKLQKLLLEKGLQSEVFWTPMAKEDADGGIDGFYAEQLQNTKCEVNGRVISHSGWLGYSFKEASETINNLTVIKE